MKPKEEPPGKEAPGPPPPAVIDLCQQTQSEEDCYMPEQIAGVKPRQEVEAETPESDDDDNQDNDGVKTETIQTETAPMHQVKDAADNNSKKARPGQKVSPSGRRPGPPKRHVPHGPGV
ncbi:hypothetical protein PR002_g4463 [Phytophthora rubi]|uniref:Uncharacterized protein n=1 Tax=Phytophthora rubi TaxID=129364 RepID=A0A6A3NAT5_9STRA|nr:hypothetical protein PR002_g4463 [Phytophthora rubi]